MKIVEGSLASPDEARVLSDVVVVSEMGVVEAFHCGWANRLQDGSRMSSVYACY